MTLPHVSKLSTGYYLLEEVRVRDSENVPVISDHCYGLIQDDIYGAEATPILFRYPGSRVYFNVNPSDDVAGDVIGLPEGIRDEIDISTRTTEDFLITRPGHAKQIHRLSNVREQIFV